MDVLPVLIPDGTELIVCDLGGVLYDIDFRRTILALQSLPGYNGRDILFGVDDQHPLFLEIDRGTITSAQFRAELRREWGFTCTDAELDAAWCAILISPFDHARRTVEHLRSHAPTVLLSNISLLHLELCLPQCEHFFPLFTERFYSCVMHARKPDAAAFTYVLDTMGIAPDKALMIDDSQRNCEEAANVGMRVHRVVRHER
jgi:putative hydrolase of the HAD superfamily